MNIMNFKTNKIMSKQVDSKEIKSKPKLYTMLGNVFCYLWRHKIAFNDSGCDVCGRCGKHEYYDNDFDSGKPLFKTYYLIRHKLLLLKSWYKIKFFNELPF
jgi:hypothetical protein